ncbi:NAD(P)/FAD-dependent oxidoreductase [Profundibacter sp.]|uniref:NAD(P)/FAD-dependent oxidoreductase n=1 Tax=Profundibacter sp. TaxID=3101071 RepID=UPI003D11DE0E
MSRFEGIYNRPYWWDDSGLPDAGLSLDPQTLPDTVETLVIGAGYSGLSAALTLARAGREVTVIDSDMIGYGCSSRNGGQIGPSFHKLGVAGLTAAFGQAKATAILRESMDSLTYLKTFIADEGIKCDMQPESGRFKGISRAGHYEETARSNEDLAKAVGFTFEMVPKAQQSAHIGSDFYHGGAVYPKDGQLQPAKFVAGLAQTVIDAGAQRDGDRFAVRIGDRTVSAGQVLVATNGYSGPELPFFHRRIMPLRSAIIATEQLSPDLIHSAFPDGKCVVDSSRLVLYYRPSPDGTRVVFGGRAFDNADRPDHYAPDLRRLMLRIFPQLADAKITHAWSGTVAYTFDYAPHLGCYEGLHYVLGYCGSGVGRATYFGHKAALKMLGDKGGETALDGLEFPTRAFYNGKPWFLPAVLRWQSIMDHFGA